MLDRVQAPSHEVYTVNICGLASTSDIIVTAMTFLCLWARLSSK